MPLDYEIAVVCDRGRAPEDGGRVDNEDNYLIAHQGSFCHMANDVHVSTAASGNGVMVAVADGMGGHNYGKLAAEAAIRMLSRRWMMPVLDDPETDLHAFVLQGHRRLRAKSQALLHQNMGTTLAIGWIVADVFYWVHVGDSRIYLLRDGALRLLTRDHTRGEFALRDGLAIPRRARHLAQSFLFGSRGLKQDEDIRIDAGTDTGHVPLLADDVVLLCSDGVSNFVSEDAITAALVLPPNQATERLFTMAVESGSDDNVTAVVVRVASPASG